MKWTELRIPAKFGVIVSGSVRRGKKAHVPRSYSITTPETEKHDREPKKAHHKQRKIRFWVRKEATEPTVSTHYSMWEKQNTGVETILLFCHQKVVGKTA